MWRLAALLLLARAVHSQSVTIACTNSVTGEPLAAVQLRLRGPATYSGATDVAGVFRVPAAAPGNYTIDVIAKDFSSPADARQPIHVGESPVRLSFELTPLGKVQGRVLFPDGRPATGAKVTLETWRPAQWRWATTDTDGHFTLTAPTRGRFRLSAEVPTTSKAPAGEGWAPTYYPDATDARDAQPIALPLGADLSGYDIRLRSVPVRRVHGVVFDDAGKPAPGATVELAGRKIVTAENGAFAFDAVRMGEWRLEASLERGVTLYATEFLTVGRRDLDDVKLRLVRPFSLPVTMTWDDPPDPKASATLALIPEPPRFGGPSGNRVIRNVDPGRYTINPILGNAPGYYIASIRLGDREVLGQKIDLVEGAPPLHVVWKRGAGSIRAHVDRGAGTFVAAIPQDDHLLFDSILRFCSADADGNCDLRQVRPGDYYVYAFDDQFDYAALHDPAFVARLIPRAEKVHVDENGAASVSLKVSPWPE